MNTIFTRKRLLYLATPYTKYSAGIERAFIDAAALAGRLLQAGAVVYSPIAHVHPIAVHGNIDPLDHKIWLPFDEVMMERADGLLVALMDGWRESFGVRYEIGVFVAACKPIHTVDPVTLDLGLLSPDDSPGALAHGSSLNRPTESVP